MSLTRPLMIPGFNWIGNERVFSIPIPLIIMVVTFFVLWLVMTKTKFGRFCREAAAPRAQAPDRTTGDAVADVVDRAPRRR